MRLPASGSREALWLVGAALIFGVLGIVLGLNSPVQIPPGYSRYTAVMILAALDSVLGAVKAWLNGNFENKVFISGLLVNSIVPAASRISATSWEWSCTSRRLWPSGCGSSTTSPSFDDTSCKTVGLGQTRAVM